MPFTGDPVADSDGDGLTDLLEYALGQDPVVAVTRGADGVTFTVPRAPGADDAAVQGEYGTTLGEWAPAEFAGHVPGGLVFRVPAAAAASGRLFVRASVRRR